MWPIKFVNTNDPEGHFGCLKPLQLLYLGECIIA